jgi:hypothetical protein
MGVFKGTSRELDAILNSMRDSYKGTDYHVITKNCNAFADEFLQRLLGVESPGYVNRMAFFGSFFAWCLPENLNQDPTQQQQQGGGGASYGNSSSSSGGVYKAGNANNRPGSSAGGGSSSSQNKAFSGTSGTKLGGTPVTSEPTCTGTSVNVSVDERREKMRLAALSRAAPGGSY